MTHEHNPAKAFLSRYQGLKAKCAALERAIREAMEDATNTTVTLKQICVQTSGGGQRMAEDVVRLVDATALLCEEQATAGETMRQIMEAINSVPDETQQTLLIDKYINGRTLGEIQTDIHYERRNTQILHGKALWSVWQWMKKRGLCE